MNQEDKYKDLINEVLQESIKYKNKAREIETWLLKLDLDPNKDLAYITMVGYIKALEFVISKAKSIGDKHNDKTYGANFFNKNGKNTF